MSRSRWYSHACNRTGRSAPPRCVSPLLAAVTVLSATILAGCGGGAGRQPIDDAVWKARMKEQVSFPLPEQITLSVGVMGEPPQENNISVAWLEEKTNIRLEFMPLPGGQTGLIELGIMFREDRAPDLIPEAMLAGDTDTLHAEFIDLFAFPSLTPTFNRLLQDDLLFRRAVAARVLYDGTLYSLGRYRQGAFPTGAALAFRQDLFVKHSLAYDTFAHLRDSLLRLKQLFPDSTPMGCTAAELPVMGPAMFGSGYLPRKVVYYNHRTGDWALGPMEPEFREFLRYFATLYREGLLSPNVLTAKKQDLLREYAAETVFVSPWRGDTGPRFPARFPDVGSLTAEGRWDGTGVWVGAMPLPLNESGQRGRLDSSHWSPVIRGWCVSKRCAHPAEAIALLDWLFRTEAGLVSRLGPEDEIWRYKEGKPILAPDIEAPVNPTGSVSVKERLRAKGATTGIPLVSLIYDTAPLLGTDKTPLYRYLRDSQSRIYYDREALTAPPPPALRREGGVLPDMGTTAASLTPLIEQAVFEFIYGRRPLSEYPQFLQKLEKMGAQKLLDLYRENSRRITDEMLLAGRKQSP